MAYIKKEDEWKHKPLTGDHQVTPDGEHVFIGRHKFKRTVLPSHAAVIRDQTEQEALYELQDSDKLTVQEQEVDADSEQLSPNP